MQVRKNTAFIDALFYMIVCVCACCLHQNEFHPKSEVKEKREKIMRTAINMIVLCVSAVVVCVCGMT